MMSNAFNRISVAFVLFLLLCSPCFAREKFLFYSGVIHIHSNVSKEGALPLRKIVSLARDKGIKILVFSDTFLQQWEYGLPVFSNIFKISKDTRSASKYGISNYLKDLQKTRDEFPDMVILEGVEVTPFYWWSGNLFKGIPVLHDGNKHLLVIGLKNKLDYTHLPVVCNRYLFPQLKDALFLLFPFSLIFLGISLIKKRKKNKSLGFVINILGILFLFNSFPFSSSQYYPCNGDKGPLPFQKLINYVNNKSGLAVWAHPEVARTQSIGKYLNVNFSTPSYTDSLMLTSGYAGFGINLLSEASRNLILAGKAWDDLLINYCLGKRSKPAWVIGEADYQGNGQIGNIQNMFFLPEFKPDAAYRALGEGKLYIRYCSENKVNIFLEDFRIEDTQAAGNSASIAEEIKLNGKPKLCIKGNYAISPFQDIRLEVIRDGKIIKEFKLSNDGLFDIEFQDDYLETKSPKSYYRLNFFAGDKIILATNPIFTEIN